MDKTLLEDNKIFSIVYDTLANNLFGFANIVNPLRQREIARSLTAEIIKDRDALREKDPAAQLFGGEKGNDYVLSYKSLEAVMMYRIYHYIYNFRDDNSADIDFLMKTQARKLSDKTKVETSVEIHPAAQIGERFVIDHGCSTVIGETCEIGDNCYILHGVTLGAPEFGKNEEKRTGRRHPKLGSNVRIGGFARLFGPITIGSNVIIYGYTVVDRDIPDNKTVSVVNQFQLCYPDTKATSISIYGLRPSGDRLEIIGKNLGCCTSVELLNGNVEVPEHFPATIEHQSDSSVIFSINDIENIIKDASIKSYKIVLYYGDNDILLANSVGWKDYVENKKLSI